jgi:AAA family ATP:ADP antiporter
MRRLSSTAYNDQDDVTSLWSGVLLILQHNYVLLILGVSCLYEVSLTCLNYQMTLLGWTRFEVTPHHKSMSFTQFMGHYGQLVNVLSLALSSVLFPWVIQRFGLRLTLRIFPSLLILINFIAFAAIPGNLAVLFLSMSVLKAMTYSIHDPSKEILYLPTSNAIKFKSKFWIDVVGARIAKAFGSSINRLAGSVDRSIQIASFPSLLTAMGLLYVCYQVGVQFDELVASDTVVGVSDVDSRSTREYEMVHTAERRMEYEEDEDEADDEDEDDDDIAAKLTC